MRSHLRHTRDCALSYFTSFWCRIIADWDSLDNIDRNTAAIEWWFGHDGACVCGLTGQTVVRDHLRVASGDGCMVHIGDLFESHISAGGRPSLEGMKTLWRRG